MARFTDAELDSLKSRVDLPALIRARGVELKNHGDGHLIGKCPFHADDTPSFVVTPGKGLFHCLGCGEAGNAIQFVMKSDGLSFRHAVELLRGDPAKLFSPLGSRPRVLECPLDVEADDTTLLRQVFDYYAKRLRDTPDALAYLAKRGVCDPEAIATFGIGYADRSLGLHLPEKTRKEGKLLRERLTALGLYRESGHEHFAGCIVFPIPDDTGRIVGVYGRRLQADARTGVKHLYLPGPHRGVWNAAGLNAGREIILCESILDALSWWCAGWKSVTTAYGVEGFTEEIEAHLAKHADKVYPAYDRDEAGDRGAVKAARRLMARGVECLRVQFPPGLDANEFAVKCGGSAPAEFGRLIHGAEWMGRGEKTSVVEAAGPEESPVPAAVVVPRVARASSFSLAAKSLAALPAQEPAPMAAKEKSIGESVKVESSGRIVEAALPSVSSESSCSILRDTPEEVVLSCGDREYRVRGLSKNTGFETLRISLRIACNGRWHLDTLDLCRAKERAHYIEAAAAETLLKPDLLRRDLGRVLLKLEELQEARLRAQVAPDESPSSAMSEADKAAGMELLKSPDLLARIVRDFEACGVVGEDMNKLTGYLAAVSRKLDRPLAVIVQSTSAAGKTALMESVLELMPPEEKTKYSALTGQALYYLGDADLKNKILAVVEEEGAERASYALKLLQSEGELTIASTGKDPHTGRMETQEYRVEGPVMIFLTTTSADIDEELLNRCLVLTVDEGRAQTAAIHKLQRERETLAGLLRKEDRTRIIATHHAAQRLLRPLHVVNPFAESLTFRDDRTRTRRDHTKYLALIRTVAFLHQWQRPVKTVTHGGKTLSYIEVEASDIEAANRIAHEVLGRCLDEMPPQTRRLLGILDALVRKACEARGLEREDFAFSRRDVREATGWNDTQLRVHLGRLVELEYLVVHGGAKGRSFAYELVYDGGGTDGGKYLPGLIAPDARMKSTSRGDEANLAGWSRGLRGGSRPPGREAATPVFIGKNGAFAGEPSKNASEEVAAKATA